MAEHLKPVDITEAPYLLSLAEEVQRSHEARVLRHDSEDLALVVPLPRSAKTGRRGPNKTQPDYEALLSAAGG